MRLQWAEAHLLTEIPLQDAVVRVLRQVPFGPMMRSSQVEVPEPGCLQVVNVGSYVIEIEAPGFMTARVPVLIEGNRRSAIQVAPPSLFEGHEEFIFVEGGVANLGGESSSCLPEQSVHVEPFLIGRFPITMEAYCIFLNELAVDNPDQALSHAPRTLRGSEVYIDYCEETRTFKVPDSDRDGDPWHPQWSVYMVSLHDANAYCEWRSRREDIVYRLPTEVQWEKAARGVDGRIYPWGNGFDTALCRMRNSEKGRPYPVPVGNYRFDCSPYGVQDMAGLVIEWTRSVAEHGSDQYVMRGGCFSSPEEWCRCEERKLMYPDENGISFGFRVVREFERVERAPEAG